MAPLIHGAIPGDGDGVHGTDGSANLLWNAYKMWEENLCTRFLLKTQGGDENGTRTATLLYLFIDGCLYFVDKGK